jgi:hypothetical protein
MCLIVESLSTNDLVRRAAATTVSAAQAGASAADRGETVIGVTGVRMRDGSFEQPAPGVKTGRQP